RGLELAATAGRERQRQDFASSLSNALLWGSTDASASLQTIEGLLATVTRRLIRSSLLAGVAALRGILGDRPGAEAALDESAAIRAELGARRDEFRHSYTEYALDDFEAALRLTRAEAAMLETMGETGQRSTMVGLEAWILVLMGDDEAALESAARSRDLGAPDDAITQILWRAAAGVALARQGNAAEAERVTAEGLEIAADTDSLDAGTAWLARAMALSALGRRPEAVEAARTARDFYAQKGFVNAVRRAEALLAE
ncbi:MAG TPA: hypothetical protein VKC59_02975, partial [Candidatus Limnocylindrales bacterium]|nr:hypothetical protein [Candidatus Limnocylindrales bacterium]